jgi:hypothetical protein
MNMHRIYKPYCRKKGLLDRCVAVINTGELANGQKLSFMIANAIKA